ncbi:SGNH hydrolase-type esterase domain-containing protein [Ampelomyces quisqualis]|uniref:SGNH hydrolase-type esterase domain-containing protein n=1 Tax=Ampelomyces quisqualis TaxID=50730 RepID=A0A6A5QQL9_AMPQU|nr:SGNH hydrolase-type esterase domain-containing protein [Ampelomyces quisqualis]
MLFSTGAAFFTSLVALSTSATAAPAPGPKDKSAKPPAFFLAGDSTTAVQAENGGGWGDGFLNTTLKSGATGTNYGHNGATTVSFRDGGDWATVLAAAKNARSSYEPYVTIQFGHNDQKPEKNISMAKLTANLVKFVNEVRAVPATAILVTSLSRRRFSTSTGKINENLADVTAATKEAATKTGAKIIDLNAASTKYLNAIGPENAATYNLNPTDFTHLNSQGSVVFGNMVAVLIDEALPELKQHVVPVTKIATALGKGEYYFA